MRHTLTIADIIDKGIVLDLFEAERSYHLVTALADFADSISDDERNYSLYFATSQQLAQHTMLISLARIYDKPSKTYPTLSLMAALDMLADTHQPLPKIIEKPNLAKTLTSFSKQDSDLATVLSASDSELRLLIHDRISTALESPNIVDAKRKLKDVRDKRLAHREKIEDLQSPSWAAFLELLRIAQESITILGWAYTSTIHSIDGRYLMSDDAERPTRCMKRILKELNFSEANAG